VNLSTSRSKGELLNLPAGRQGFTLHFGKLSVLSVSKEAVLLYSALKGGFSKGRTGERSEF